MFHANLEFNFNPDFSHEESASPFCLPEDLSGKSRLIHENAVFLAKEYLVAEAALLEALIEVDRHEVYRELGFAYLTPYCEKHLGLSPDVAAVFVRVARKSREIPELKTAVLEGLSLTKAKAIVSVLTPENQTEWIAKAQALSKEKLEREIVKTYPLPKNPERTRPTGENRTRIEFELTDEPMVLQRKAQDLVSRKTGKSASLAETQEKLLEVFLFYHDPVQKAERSQRRKGRTSTQVRAGAENKSPMGRAVRPPMERAREKAATSKVSPGQTDRSRDRSQSSNKRKPLPTRVLHAVHQRDQGRCQEKRPDGSFCHGARWTEIHHVVSKARGGSDLPENLITLCSAHHRQRHRPS